MIIKGILLFRDAPQVRLDIDTNAGRYVSSPVNEDPVLPYEFAVMGINKESLELFLNERVMPAERQSIKSVLDWAGIPFYDKVLIAERNYYSSCDDDFWIQPEDDSITWAEIRKL